MNSDSFTAERDGLNKFASGKSVADSIVPDSSAAGTITAKKPKIFLVRILCLHLILSSACTAAALLFSLTENHMLFYISVAGFAAVSIGTALCIIECRKTERYMKLYLNGNGNEPLQLIRFNYSASTEQLLARQRKTVPLNVQWEENRRKAEYLALQNQINPHFLYNTLEAIRSEAVIGGLDTVADMSETLANFFRYTISNTFDLVTLADEIKNVQNYFTIQKFRFGDRINLVVEIPADEPLRFYRLPKLILQPIVENAIIHGLEDKIGGGQILIKARTTSNKFCITVEDNGRGIEYNKLIDINRHLGTQTRSDRQPEKHSSIAIYNVNDRLQLLYGQQYGLTYFSIPQIGTTVEIVLPKIPEDES